MARTIVVLSGEVAAGKSTLARGMSTTYGATVVSTRELLQDRFRRSRRGGTLRERRALQDYGEHLDAADGGLWLAEDVAALVGRSQSQLIVIDAVRILGQIEGLRRRFGRKLWHVHVTSTSEAELAERYELRRAKADLDELTSYAALRENRTEAEAVPALAQYADVVLDTHRNTPADVLMRCGARVGLLSDLGAQLVDVLVGGEYGSEGKGNIAFYLAPEYEVLVRVGGPNAGHQVPTDQPTTHRSLPSGALANLQAQLVIGPGAVINSSVLLDEIASTSIDPGRISIDPQAMLISEEDIAEEAELTRRIASTGQGVGRAAARRILARTGDRSVLAESDEGLAHMIRPTRQVLDEAYAASKRILLEGTQGMGLSIFHGTYPHVTSRDTTAAGVLSEAGISPRRVRRTVVVFRTYPIRVGGPSGPMGGRELDWDEIASRSGLDRESIDERGSVSGNQRRVAEFDWTQLRTAAEINGATDIAVTFADYIDGRNKSAYRFDQLTPLTIQLLEEMERVSGAPVSLISTEFSRRAIIDRRDWRGHVLA